MCILCFTTCFFILFVISSKDRNVTVITFFAIILPPLPNFNINCSSIITSQGGFCALGVTLKAAIGVRTDALKKNGSDGCVMMSMVDDDRYVCGWG